MKTVLVSLDPNKNIYVLFILQILLNLTSLQWRKHTVVPFATKKFTSKWFSHDYRSFEISTIYIE